MKTTVTRKTIKACTLIKDFFSTIKTNVIYKHAQFCKLWHLDVWQGVRFWVRAWLRLNGPKAFRTFLLKYCGWKVCIDQAVKMGVFLKSATSVLAFWPLISYWKNSIQVLLGTYWCFSQKAFLSQQLALWKWGKIFMNFWRIKLKMNVKAVWKKEL